MVNEILSEDYSAVSDLDLSTCLTKSVNSLWLSIEGKIAGSFFTSYRFYDSIYTERYMRTPKENQKGYEDNPISRAEKMHGALLLCHGLADDNVHPQNTFEYTEALVQADKDFTMNVYTNRNHSIYGGNTRNHLLRQISQFFINHLK